MGQAVPAGEAQHDGTAQPHAIVVQRDGDHQVWIREGYLRRSPDGPTHSYLAWIEASDAYNHLSGTFPDLTDATTWRDHLNILHQRGPVGGTP